MKHIASVSSIGGYTQCEESLYECNFRYIPGIKRWKHNRPPDDLKVQEIISTMKNGTYVSTPLLGYFNIKDGKIKEVHIYDGSHRLEALKQVYNTGMLGNGSFVIQACINPTEEQIKMKFRLINKVTPVSEIYTDMNDPQEMLKYRKFIDEFGDQFTKTYQKNKSTAKNPHPPNYNPYHFKDEFSQLCIEYPKVKDYTTEYIMGVFNTINTLYKDAYTNITPTDKLRKYIDKAHKSGCFLFIDDKTKWKNDFIRITQSSD